MSLFLVEDRMLWLQRYNAPVVKARASFQPIGNLYFCVERHLNANNRFFLKKSDKVIWRNSRIPYYCLSIIAFQTSLAKQKRNPSNRSSSALCTNRNDCLHAPLSCCQSTGNAPISICAHYARSLQGKPIPNRCLPAIPGIAQTLR